MREHNVSDEYRQRVIEAYSRHKGSIKEFAKSFPEYTRSTIGVILRRDTNILKLHEEEGVVWVPLPELKFEEKQYEISNKGQVRKSWNGQLIHSHWNGKRYINTIRFNKKTHYFQTHILMAKAFLKDFDPKVYDVLFKDKNYRNLDISNLQLQLRVGFRGTFPKSN